MKRSLMVEGRGIPLGGCWPRRTGTTPRCWPPRWTNSMTSARCRTTSRSTSTPGTTYKTRDELARRSLTGEIAHKGDKAPIQAGEALARRADQRLAQRLQPAATLLRT